MARADQPDGARFFYSDGIFSASVFEQQGDLDWDALPAGGTTTRSGWPPRPPLRGAERHRAGVGDGDLVYTTVTDAPSDEVAGMVAGLSGPDRSGPESVVDYVLGPFSWG